MTHCQDDSGSTCSHIAPGEHTFPGGLHRFFVYENITAPARLQSRRGFGSVFRYLTLTGALSYAATLTVLVGGIYWKRANARGAYWAFLGSAAPPIACLAMPGIDPTHAGLLSFVLAPIGLMAGSLTSAKGRDPRGIGMND